ncbi:MAG: SpoIVB peptidase [Lachnospiraceae bacterium]|nr:SpoIVB peptidase [Lachnospiraceae bacterium]
MLINKKIYRLFLIVMLFIGIGLLINSIKTDYPDNTIKSNRIVEKQEVYVAGLPVGIYLHTQGVMVLDIQNVVGIDGNIKSPAKGIIQKNDYITEFNGRKIYNKRQLQFLINENKQNKIHLIIKRNEKNIDCEIEPILDRDGEYKIGIWIRDDAQGIGTLTYINSDNGFGALGHGISDMDTGQLLDSEEGKIYYANIWGVKKGLAGEPGGLCGSIDYDDKNIVGSIGKNSSIGLYGNITSELIKKYNLPKYEVGSRSSISTDKAYIQMIEEKEIKLYQIKILKVVTNKWSEKPSSGKDFIIRVTDEKLLDKTNGIVQGMSGCPIIQNNKIIGAVTHVFVDTPKEGYGIFIDRMVNENS